MELINRRTHFDELPDVMTPQEVACYLDLHVKTIRAYIAAGDLKAARNGKYYMIRKQWVLDYLENASRYI